MMNKVYEVQVLKKWWHRTLVFVAARVLKLYCSTLRFSPDRSTRSAKQNLRTLSAPALLLFWHNNLFVSYKLNKLRNRRIPLYGLVSPSRDGAWLAEIFNQLGMLAIRGSSLRNGLSAIVDVLEKLAEGGCIAITPDGPRGPIYKFKNGAAMIFTSSSADIMLIAIKYSRFFSLPSWDKFKIPWPFSKVSLLTKTFLNKDFKDTAPKDLTNILEVELKDLQSKLDESP